MLNPYFDNPVNFIAYEADDVLEEVKIVLLLPDHTSHIKAMEDFYGINRVELANLRYNTFREFRIFKKTLNETIPNSLRNDIVKQIDFMKSDKALFAGMVRYFDRALDE